MNVFKNTAEWESWLQDNHSTEKELWLGFAKKGTGVTTITYDEALLPALCYGWIDGLTNKVDDTYYKIRYTPRGPKSIWSARNVEIVDRLIKEKKMKPAGMAAVEAAQKDGRWAAAYASPKNMQVPDDFLKELSKDKKAFAFYKTLNRTNTYAIAWRLATAKKPETRNARMKKLIYMMKRGEKIH